MSGFDWPALMRLGLRDLRMTAEDFWRLTPAELMLIAGLDTPSNTVVGRARLMELSARFPDKDIVT